ncbi:MAG: CHC2 zinc finger domain-containing protein [Candidatus Aminicenantes bacterium]|nr:CHC2 zinc finger domain-containing protein [Candidatus Aminicenantes bacterium]
MANCHLCSKKIEATETYHLISVNQVKGEGNSRQILGSQEVAFICDDCFNEGLGNVFLSLRHIHRADTQLLEKMEAVKKSLNLVDLLKEFAIIGEPVGTSNLYLARCPFHQQDSSFLYDDKEYYCFCEGLKGDIFSFIMNYYRDIERQEMTLKKAVDFLMSKIPA